MEEIEFIFQSSAFDVDAFLPQISRALEKRMQLRQQQVLPRLFRRANNGKKKKKDDRYDKAAREFLEAHAEDVREQKLQICFSDEEMIMVKGALEDLDQDAVSFDGIEFVMESDDMFLVIYQGRGVILQKKDLSLGNVDEFRNFVSERIKPVISLSEEE